MNANLAQRMQSSGTWIESEKFCRKYPTGSLRCSSRLKEKQKFPMIVSADFQPKRNKNGHRTVSLKVFCSYKNSPGMMGSGKTTVGKILSQVLGYSFCDCDTLVEQDVDGASVAEIFKLYGEGFFRNKETEALKKLSMMHRLVVSTGGGAVIRPINWKYMQKGISVWLDVPLEALAQRIAAVGTNSRPLLHHESGDEYTKAFRRLSTLLEERGEYYANANARVSLENIAAKLGYRDVSSITPTAIAIEALEKIENFLEEEEGIAYNGNMLNKPLSGCFVTCFLFELLLK
ncbi:hypothetical protein GH714_037174 [Hevea brasiliensis]|uniref:shikimate kinase n=1 Tax=Hevea brasiliensis TaxID=3981 RepID=A0A6A6NF88_HEVBR|nr:hypothetical protein GH714_037174 [Hevea brasiliensis]